MVVLMGGRYSRGYALFQQLTIKAFLAIRPHAEQIISTVELMLGTGLPSFKGEPTIRRLRDRFALGLNERQAAEWMVGVVKNAHENMRSIAYDEFQRVSLDMILLFAFVTGSDSVDSFKMEFHINSYDIPRHHTYCVTYGDTQIINIVLCNKRTITKCFF